jgi:hypothetical protein
VEVQTRRIRHHGITLSISPHGMHRPTTVARHGDAIKVQICGRQQQTDRDFMQYKFSAPRFRHWKMSQQPVSFFFFFFFLCHDDASQVDHLKIPKEEVRKDREIGQRLIVA